MCLLRTHPGACVRACLTTLSNNFVQQRMFMCVSQNKTKSEMFFVFLQPFCKSLLSHNAGVLYFILSFCASFYSAIAQWVQSLVTFMSALVCHKCNQCNQFLWSGRCRIYAFWLSGGKSRTLMLTCKQTAFWETQTEWVARSTKAVYINICLSQGGCVFTEVGLFA